MVVVHAFNPSTWEAEAGGSLSLRQPGLQSEFQDDNQGYTEKSCLENQPTNQQQQQKKIAEIVNTPKQFGKFLLLKNLIHF